MKLSGLVIKDTHSRLIPNLNFLILKKLYYHKLPPYHTVLSLALQCCHARRIKFNGAILTGTTYSLHTFKSWRSYFYHKLSLYHTVPPLSPQCYQARAMLLKGELLQAIRMTELSMCRFQTRVISFRISARISTLHYVTWKAGERRTNDRCIYAWLISARVISTPE